MMKTCETLMHGAQTPSSDLSSDLWSDILSRLPVNDLLKLRCICKLWCSIIDSPYFMSLNLRHYHKLSSNNNLLLIDLSSNIKPFEYMLTVHSSPDLKMYSQLYKIISGSFMILGSCKELLLITKSSYYNFDYGDENTEKMLWNPSIRKSLILPTCPLCRNHKDDQFRFLLGFSPSEDDFKVAAFRFNEGQPMDVSIAIYSLRNHEWKPEFKSVSVMYKWYQIQHSQLFSLGVAYWMGSDPRIIYYVPDDEQDLQTHLISFNFDSEEFSFIELPDAGDRRVEKRCIFLLGESVAVLSVGWESSCIWVLEKNVGFNKEPWRVWPSTQSNLLKHKFIECIDAEQRIFFDQDGDTFLLHTFDRVISHNISTDQLQFLKSGPGFLFLAPYIESLVLHKGTDGQSLTSFP